MKKINLVLALFACNSLLAMEAPSSNELVEIVFENNQKGLFSRAVLEVSKTLNDYYLPHISSGQQLLLCGGLNGSVFKDDFELYIYPLMQAVYNNDENVIHDIRFNIDILSMDDSENGDIRSKRVNNVVRFLDVGIFLDDEEQQGTKRSFGEAFEAAYKLQEPVCKKGNYQGSQPDSPIAPQQEPGDNVAILKIPLLNEQDEQIDTLVLPKEVLPFFSVLNNLHESSIAGAMELLEKNISPLIIKILNDLTPLFLFKVSEDDLKKMMNEKLKLMGNNQVVQLLKAADYLGCELLMDVCFTILSNNIRACQNEKEKMIKEVVGPFDNNLRSILCGHLAEDVVFTVEPVNINGIDKNHHITSIATSYDGNYIAIYSNETKKIYILNAQTKNVINTINSSQKDVSLHFLRNGNLLSKSPCVIKYWNINRKKSLNSIKIPNGTEMTRISPDGEICAAVNEMGYVQLLSQNSQENVSLGNLVNNAHCRGKNVHDLVIAPDNNVMAVQQWAKVNDVFVRKYKVIDKQKNITRTWKITDDSRNFGGLCFSYRGNLLASSSLNNLTIKDLKKGNDWECIFPLGVPEGKIKFSPDDATVICYKLNKPANIDIFNLRDNSSFTISDPAILQAMAISPDSSLLVLAFSYPSVGDKPWQSIELYSLKRKEAVYKDVVKCDYLIEELTFLPDGKSLICGSDKLYFINIKKTDFDFLETEDVVEQQLFN